LVLEAFGMGTSQPGVAALGAATELSFDQVYEAEFETVHRIVSRLAGKSDIDDLVQDVFLVVHRRLGEFRGEARLTTWLFRIAYRIVGANIRRERFRRRARELFGFERHEPPPEPSDEQAKVRAALAELSYERRSALVLFEVEGLSADEIARAFGVPTGTVYRRLHEARAAFRLAYAACAETDR
jgi:RNA polymerase sigma-70 factor, ECF subfamily